MARKKFKLSKSFYARAGAITVLVGMGGVAVLQSQKASPESDKSNGQELVKAGESGETDGDDQGTKKTDPTKQGNDAKNANNSEDKSTSTLRKPPSLPGVDANRNDSNTSRSPASNPSSNSGSGSQGGGTPKPTPRSTFTTAGGSGGFGGARSGGIPTVPSVPKDGDGSSLAT